MSKCTDQSAGQLLHAYELNQLASEDVERFEAHLIECDYCFEAVRRFEGVANVLTETGTVRGLLREAPAGDTFWGKIRELLWPRTLVVLRPAVAYFVILLLVYPAYLGLRNEDGSEVRAVNRLVLVPERSMVPHIERRGQDIVVNFVLPEYYPDHTYSVTVIADKGSVVFEEDDFTAIDDRGIGTLLILFKAVSPGYFRLVIRDQDEPPSVDPLEYGFIIDAD